MAGGTNEIQTGVNSQIRLLISLWLLFLSHIGLVLVINKFNDGGPRVGVVDVVTESGGINDGELDFELFLLELGLDDFDFSQLVELLMMTPIVVFRG